ncbi:MAG: HD domain-containing protein [Planctomycetota bacterium]
MAKIRCPGQDMRFWKPKDVFDSSCPKCGAAMEFWKDDPFVNCKKCGEKVRNPRIDLGCARWCKYAEQCLGYKPQVDADADMSVCERLVVAMKKEFGADQKRVVHALEVQKYAEGILAKEGGSPLVVKAAALLHDIGIKAAERKHGSSAGKYQEIEGPPIARGIMEEIGLDEETVDHVCRIIANHHSAKDIDTLEFRIIWDADRIVNIPEECGEKGPDEIRQFIERTLRTETGRSIALRKCVPEFQREEAKQ